jgi:acyl-CoA thioesterase-1
LKTIRRQRRIGFPLYRVFGRWVQICASIGVSIGLLAAPLLASASAEAAQKRVLAFGDSLTAGYRLPVADSLPAQLQRRLVADGFDARVINAGVSGDTTETGLARLDYALSAGNFDAAVLELGANDMLRGMPPRDARANLEKIIESFQLKGVNVILAAMASGDNWGQAYRQEFDSIYPGLATKYGVTMVPFFMEGVWGDPTLLIGDGLHPNAAGVAKIVNKMAPFVEKVLASKGAGNESRPQ